MAVRGKMKPVDNHNWWFVETLAHFASIYLDIADAAPFGGEIVYHILACLSSVFVLKAYKTCVTPKGGKLDFKQLLLRTRVQHRANFKLSS